MYLGLPKPTEAGNLHELPSLLDRLDYGSNEQSWNNCRWKRSKLERLVNPAVALPFGLNQRQAPRFLVSTNQADPLYDDGCDLVDKLQQRGARVRHLQHTGSHWTGSQLHKGQFAEMAGAVVELLFDS